MTSSLHIQVNADGHFYGDYILKNGNRLKRDLANECKMVFDDVSEDIIII